MDKEKITEEITEEVADKKGFIAWVKEHNTQLLLTGISVTTILATALGLKKKDAITELWNTLKKQIEKGALYSSKWFEKANLEELETARRLVQQDYNNPNLDLDYRNYCWNLLNRFNNAIEKIKWAGKEYGYPVHSSNGWHLPSDD
ncbi:hypothetical protein [Hungatella effluvii]|uniref:hypothetical protein n=1 Tax=Hungatella effluvii TaxID=1096246 RepID=UPI0022E4AB68|nr:hypothetical protein [Hungatella effluvii]